MFISLPRESKIRPSGRDEFEELTFQLLRVVRQNHILTSGHYSHNTSQMTTGVTEEDDTYAKTMIKPYVSKQGKQNRRGIAPTFSDL